MRSCYKVITDGKVFRILEYGRNVSSDRPVSSFDNGKPLEFDTKEAAQEYIHRYLSLSGWRDA